MSAAAEATGNEQEEAAQGQSFLERPFRNLDFLVYRFVHPTDKRGLPYPDSAPRNKRPGGLPGAKVWVEDFAPQWGEFLLDLGEPVYDVQDHHPLVTRLEGYGLDQGRVKHRNLQQLPFPWGIDGTLPVQIWANEVFRDNHCLPFNPKGMSRLDLQWECRRRLLPTGGKRSDLIKRINRLELPKGIQAPLGAQKAALQRLDAVTLPLHRVLEAQPPVPKTPQTPLKQPPFDVGEIVLVYGTLAADEKMCLVRDYEGNRGRISRDYLEEIEMAFGLKLNRRELVEVLERLGWPDEEDATPEPEPESAAAKEAARKRAKDLLDAGPPGFLEYEALRAARKKKLEEEAAAAKAKAKAKAKAEGGVELEEGAEE
ncbi:hypothetical protein EAF04_003545 [Stromatinia cepivora]|nr:hypothetical protein EAF04_003545 [Stromatinia cepivora]